MFDILTADYVHSRLSYRPDTGQFIWKSVKETDRHTRRWNTRYAGTIAGSIEPKGYRAIMVDRVSYKAHRLAWLMTTGEWPESQIDHINEIKNDNRFTNLRAATQSDNRHNIGKNANNVAGYKGVHYRKDSGTWRATIRHNGKIESLGSNFSTPAQAHEAYREAAIKYHGDFVHQSVGATNP